MSGPPLVQYTSTLQSFAVLLLRSPRKVLYTGAGLGGIGIAAEVDFDELADFAVEVDFVVCQGVRITSATCRQGR